MVEGIESVVVGDVHVGIVLEEQREDVIPLLADGIVEGGVAFGVLEELMVHRCGDAVMR